MYYQNTIRNKYKILVLGSSGLVGSRFVELHNNQNELLTPTLEKFDFLDLKLMEKYLKENKVSSVVNFAAFTNVKDAEEERGNKEGLCWSVNVTGIQNMVKLFDKDSVHFIHISTDMVFPGSADDPGPYDEDHELIDDSDKLTWYGYTKGEGESILSNYIKNLAILRIIYPVRARYDLKLDYLRKPLKLYNEGILYPLFNDQQISISFIDQISDTLNHLINSKKTGVFHCSSTDLTTPYEIVNYLIKTKYCVKDTVKHMSIYEFLKNAEYPGRYPIFGGLKVKKSEKALNINYSSWKEIVDQLIRQNITP